MVCVIVGMFAGLSSGDLQNGQISISWLWLAAVLGVLFIIGFIWMNQTVRHSGVTVATVASKTSFIISATGSFLIFSDIVNWQKILALVLAIPGVYLVTLKDQSIHLNKRDLKFPLAVLLSSGLIEILLKLAQSSYVAESDYHIFLITLFASAAVTGIVMQLLRPGKFSKVHIRKEIWAGLLLGIPNYGSIYFLVKVLNQKNWEASFIYPINNTGIVILSGLLAMIFFKERMSRLNVWGLILALIAIILISLGEYA